MSSWVSPPRKGPRTSCPCASWATSLAKEPSCSIGPTVKQPLALSQRQPLLTHSFQRCVSDQRWKPRRRLFREPEKSSTPPIQPSTKGDSSCQCTPFG